MIDASSEVRLLQIHPRLARFVTMLIDQLATDGFDVRVTQGLRSWSQQEALWQEGRDANGKVIGVTVTDAPPGYSWHNFGLAADCAPFDAAGNPDWNPTHSDWQHILAAGKSLGLVEGACWHHPDDPHLQLSDYPVTPTDEDRQLFKDGGEDAVWKHYWPNA